jgi:hypothetical protein
VENAGPSSYALCESFFYQPLPMESIDAYCNILIAYKPLHILNCILLIADQSPGLFKCLSDLLCSSERSVAEPVDGIFGNERRYLLKLMSIGALLIRVKKFVGGHLDLLFLPQAIVVIVYDNNNNHIVISGFAGQPKNREIQEMSCSIRHSDERGRTYEYG